VGGAGVDHDGTAEGEVGVDLGGRDPARRSDELGEDGREVARAATDVEDVIALADVEGLNEEAQKARLAVVQPARFVDGHQHVVIEMSRVGIRSGPVTARVGLKDPPRSRAEEALARHPRERLDDGRRGQVSRVGQLLGVATERVGLSHRIIPDRSRGGS
jgi:hypothetical protein